MKDTRRLHPEEARILAGGQGRTAGDIKAAANYVLVCLFLLLAMICVLVLGGCARPTAYVPAGERTQAGETPAVQGQAGETPAVQGQACETPRGPRAGESSASEKPDRPRWEKLRQQIGGL